MYDTDREQWPNGWIDGPTEIKKNKIVVTQFKEKIGIVLRTSINHFLRDCGLILLFEMYC